MLNQDTALLEDLPRLVNDDEALVRRGRWVNLTFVLGIGPDDFLVHVEAGRIRAVEPRRLQTQSGRFAIRAAAETWVQHWRAVPRRDYHDIWSMLPRGLASLDGDLLPLMQNLQYFKDVIASLRASPRKQG